MSLVGKDVVSVLDLSRTDFEKIFQDTDRILEAAKRGESLGKPLEGRIVALAFFEPSTRTRLSFETAVKKLGGKTIGFTSEEAISIAKGESLADTIRMLDSYSDLIIIRHRYEGAAKYAAEIAEHPVINAGDGAQHHPTQAILDLYTVNKLFGRVDNLTYMLLGDLRYARTAASFALALTRFKPKKLYLASPSLLKLREEVKDVLINNNMNIEEIEDPKDVIEEVDVLYVTRVQKERFPDPLEYEKVKGSYRVDKTLLQNAKESLRILHPLPRVDEIPSEIDSTVHAAYFIQAKLGIPVRMALLLNILGVEW